MRGLRPNFSPSVEHRKAISEAAEKENLKRKLNPEYAALLKIKLLLQQVKQFMFII
jgi:hypothetical protein